MLFRKMRFRWVRFHIEISKVTLPNFTGLVSPNAGGIAVDRIKIRFLISSSVSEIFEVVRNRAKFCMFFAPEIFLGCAPQVLDRHYKIRPSIDHRAKFQAGRPTHLGDLVLGKKTSALKQKSFRKLSFSGGLKNIMRKHKSAPQAIAFGRTNYVSPRTKFYTLATRPSDKTVALSGFMC